MVNMANKGGAIFQNTINLGASFVQLIIIIAHPWREFVEIPYQKKYKIFQFGTVNQSADYVRMLEPDAAKSELSTPQCSFSHCGKRLPHPDKLPLAFIFERLLVDFQ